MLKQSCRNQVWKLFLACFFTLFNVGLGFAQDVKVSGVVTDNLNEPVIGASVVVKGTTIGTTTDFDGNYALEVPATGKTLVFSYIGMKSQEVAVKAGTLNVKLVDDAQDLDEVVVIGYGTAKKRDLTGSVSSVSAKQLENVPVANVAEAMAGKLAGVQVTTSEGSPDAEVKIRVRGGGSISQDNSPLYIVDGFPVTSISDIAPSDIQSMDVLKDASSTAIYGSRGANGVVIITTKGAKDGKLTVSYGGNFGFKKIAKTLDVLSPYEFAKLQYEQAVLQNKVGDRYEKSFGLFQDMDLYKEMQGIDWQNEAYGRTGTVFTNNVSVSGGSEKVSFMASYSHTDDKAIMEESKYRRDNFSFKVNAKPVDRVKINFTGRFSETDVLGAGANDSKAGGGEKSSSDSRLKHTVIYAPIDLLGLSDSEEDDEEIVGSLVNPLKAISDNYRKKMNQIYSFNGGVSIDLIKGLTFRTDLGLEHRKESDNRYYGTSTYAAKNSPIVPNAPLVSLQNRAIARLRNTNTLNYEKRNIGGKHTLSFLLGEETTSTKTTNLYQEVHGIPEMFTPAESFGFLTEGTPQTVKNTYALDDKMISFFGRANYDLMGRYMATLTMRADGSSKFARGNRWGYFPSAALAWRLSDEGFMQGATDWLSNLKVRASYGVAGNNNIDAGAYMQTFGSSTESWMNIGNSYWGPGKELSNKDLKWETTYTYNVGVDFGFFNNRLNGSVEAYQNDVKDLLIKYAIAGTGYSTVMRNVGQVRNRGVELTLTGIAVDKKDWGLDVSFNIGYNQNRVIDLGGKDTEESSGWTSDGTIAGDYRVMVGQSVGVMYGYVTEGFYKADDFDFQNGKWVLKNKSPETPDNSTLTGQSWGPGALKLKDLNGDGEITADDRTIIGNATPKFIGGFNLNARYKGFDLSAAFSYTLGNKIYNANKIEFTTSNKYYNRNMLTDVEGRYTQINWQTGERVTDTETLNAMNANASIWSPVIPNYFLHSWAVEDGSFLRLNSLTFGYSLPKSLIKKAYIQQCRFFFTGTNLFCLTKYSGFDPEVDSRRATPMTPGVDYSAYPKSRGYNFGVNLTF